MNCSAKIVVFDLDETLGYFTEFGMFWDALKNYYKNQNINQNINNINQNQNQNRIFNQEFFNKTLDLYPEFTRPNIINILNYLRKKKQDNHCHKLMIYTNNQGPVEWAQQIKTYFESKINYKLFDQIIAAFKVNGKHVELCRTTHMKTHKDFISCTKIPETTQICFIDDVFHQGMINDNIYYIHIKPYSHDLQFDTIIDRFIGSGLLDAPTSMKADIITAMKRYNYTYVEKSVLEHEIDNMLSKKILHHLHIFFNKQSTTGTLRNKNKGKSKNKTVKNKIIK